MNQFKKGLKYFIKLKHKNVNGRKLFCLSILIALITIGNLQIMAQEIHYKTQAELEMEKLEKLKTVTEITASLLPKVLHCCYRKHCTLIYRNYYILSYR